MAGCGSGEDSEGCGILSRLSDCDWKLGSMRGMSHILTPAQPSQLPFIGEGIQEVIYKIKSG